MKKRLPTLKSDRAAEAFVAEAGLSSYDLPGLLKAVRSRANKAGVPYQRFIRIALERPVQDKR